MEAIIDSFAQVNARFRMQECNPCATPGYFNPNLGPASEMVLNRWMPNGREFAPSFLQGPPFFCPRGPQGMPMPGPQFESPYPFEGPFQDFGGEMPPCPSRGPSFGGFRPSIPNYGAEYRYPEYAMLKDQARQDGTLDGTPVTPNTGFQQDRFHTEMLARLSGRADGRLAEATQFASPREFQALQQNENRLEDYLGFQAAQGQQFSPLEVNNMRSQGIEQLYQDGAVGQGIGQANREALELQEAAQRSQANVDLKYGMGPQDGMPRRAYDESPFNSDRQPPQQCQRPPHLPDQQSGQNVQNPAGPGQNPTGAPAEPKKPAYDPNADANRLYKSMHGGLFGFGHDSEALFKSLDGKTPEQIDKIRANYKDHYAKDLDADLKSKLSGKELDRANDLLKGNQSAADAAGISKAFGTLWNDNKGIETLLSGKTPEQMKQIADQYKAQTGKDLKSDLADKMSGADKDKALALFDGDKAKAAVADIKKADGWFSTDGKAIADTLEGKSPEERAAISKAYKEKYGVDLKDHLQNDLSGAKRDEAQAALDGNTAKVEAAKLKDAQGIFWSDKKSIYGALEGKSDAERAAISEEYKKTYGQDLRSALQDDLSGSKLEKAETLLDKGKLTDAESLRFALDQSDKDTIKATLAGKSKEQIAAMSAEYEQATGRTLQDDIGDKLSGRDLFQAQQDLKGKPTSLEEAVQRANEAHDFERDGGFGQGLVDTFSDKGERLDTDNDKINASNQRYQQLKAEGRYDEARAEAANLQKLVGYSGADVENYQDAKDSAAKTAGTIAATGAGVAVMVATAGTATPLVAMAAMAATAGAGAKVLTSGAIEGQDYTHEQASSDLMTGAIDGGVSVLGGVGAGTVGKEIAVEGAERTFGQVVLDGTIQGAKDGAVMGAVGSGAHTAVDGNTWEDGLGTGLERIGTATAIGTATGIVAGGVTGGAMSAGREFLAARNVAPEIPPEPNPTPTPEPTPDPVATNTATSTTTGTTTTGTTTGATTGTTGTTTASTTTGTTGTTTASTTTGTTVTTTATTTTGTTSAAAQPRADWREVAGFKTPEADKGDWMVRSGLKMNSVQREQWAAFQDRMGFGNSGEGASWGERFTGWKDRGVAFVKDQSEGLGVAERFGALRNRGSELVNGEGGLADRVGDLRARGAEFMGAEGGLGERLGALRDRGAELVNGEGGLVDRAGALKDRLFRTGGDAEVAATENAGPKGDWKELWGLKLPEADKGDVAIASGMKLNSVQREFWKNTVGGIKTRFFGATEEAGATRAAQNTEVAAASKPLRVAANDNEVVTAANDNAVVTAAKENPAVVAANDNETVVAANDAVAAKVAGDEAPAVAPKSDWKELLGLKIPEADKGDVAIASGMKLNSAQRQWWGDNISRVKTRLFGASEGAGTGAVQKAAVTTAEKADVAAADEAATVAPAATGKRDWGELLGFKIPEADKGDIAVASGYKLNSAQQKFWKDAMGGIKGKVFGAPPALSAAEMRAAAETASNGHWEQFNDPALWQKAGGMSRAEATEMQAAVEARAAELAAANPAQADELGYIAKAENVADFAAAKAAHLEKIRTQGVDYVNVTNKLMMHAPTPETTLASEAGWKALTDPEGLARAGITPEDFADTQLSARALALQTVKGDTNFPHLAKITEFYHGMGLSQLAASRQGALREIQQGSLDYVTRRQEFLGTSPAYGRLVKNRRF